MRFTNRLAGLALVYVAALALAFGCQSRDAGIPTEADRTLETAGPAEDAIIALIDELFDPALGKSVKKSFQSIVDDLKKNKVAIAQKKTQSLADFIIDHYLKGNLIPQDDLGPKVGNLNLELFQYAGLIPNVEDAAGAACLPGDPVCEAFPAEGLVEVPGDLITQPFTLLIFEVDCSTLDPGVNWVPPCYEVQTYPEQTFDVSASSSLSLSQFETPVVGVCADFPDGLTAGIDVFLYHSHDGVIEQTPFVNIVVCDGDESETASRWATPLFATFRPVLDILGPQPLYAAGLGSVSGSISEFSTLFACLPGCLSTTTTVEILEGDGPFSTNDPITIQATVTPEPDNAENPQVVFNLATVGPPAPVEPVVDGVATHTFTCGVDVPYGSHTGGAAFLGTAGHELSMSGQVLAFDCVE